MTLTEFLLARIAEDEAHVREMGWAIENRSELQYLSLEPSDEYPTMYVRPSRVLAECEAKRQIVEGSLPYVVFGGYEVWPWQLQALALPYADHPDYRPEFAP